MNKSLLSFARPLNLIMVLVVALSLAGRGWLARNGIEADVVTAGVLILYISSMAAFFISGRALRSSNPQAFVRAMYGSFMVKFFLLIVAAFIYIMIAKKNVNKPALGICGALYIIFTIFETRALTRLLKQKKNA